MGDAEMPEKKADGRVRYTRMVIRESLIALMHKKPLAKITVTEICKLAEINRATFYVHYSDPFDLLSSIEDDMMEDIGAGLENAFYPDVTNIQVMLTWVFEYVRENADICTVLLSDTSDTSFHMQVVSMLQERFVESWASAGAVTEEDAEYLFTFAAIGSVGLIRKWLHEGMKKSPDEMAEMVMKLSNQGYSAF
ncbi:MAG: TetR/AcrR family transcriptional regulator [Clostridia bacterium]|nr:TetR/AcrR family transcriptional regulator [Clostridia bacterium]